MRTQNLTRVLPALPLLALAGCLATWQPGGAPYTTSNGGYTLRVPAGWFFIEDTRDRVLATKDGLILQRLAIETHDTKDPLPQSKRALSASLTSLELAEAVADDLRADRNLHGLEIKETTAAQIDGRPGFRIVLSFHTEDKLRVSQTIYGCLEKQKLYLLNFSAPTRHYFERDLPVFEETVRSFRFGKP
jgi:hypothetical protein